jgi:hypothetical protein
MTKAGGGSPKKSRKGRWALRLRTIQRFSRVEDCRLDNRDLRVTHVEVERDYTLELERPGWQSSLIGNLFQRFINALSKEDVD